jgi:hypothetical protein
MPVRNSRNTRTRRARTRATRSAGASLTAVFLDASGQPLADRVDVLIRSQTLNRTLLDKKNHDGTKALTVAGLSPLEVCSVQVFPVRHRPVNHFLRPSAQPALLRCPVDPERVTRMVAARYDALAPRAQALLQASLLDHPPQNQSGPALYDALADLPRAGLLNLLAKMGDTTLLDGSTVLDHVDSLYRVRGDRVFANVARGLRDLVKTAAGARKFILVDGSLHHPPDGFTLFDSYKTIPDKYGNLQVTFFASVAAPRTFKADIDIDDAQGIEHVFQVLGHWLTGEITHPYDIHEILLAYQGLDPGYRLET